MSENQEKKKKKNNNEIPVMKKSSTCQKATHDTIVGFNKTTLQLSSW